LAFEKHPPTAFAESGYLLDATNPNWLWFGQFEEWNRLDLNCLLCQSTEELDRQTRQDWNGIDLNRIWPMRGNT